LLVCACCVFLTLALIILLGTLWPVISKLWSSNAVGLTADFYNTVCLPLFLVLALMLAACPWIKARGGIRREIPALVTLLVMFATAGMLFALGMNQALPLAAAAAAAGICTTIVLLFTAEPDLVRLPAIPASHGVHLGFALMVLGVAFSGPYQSREDLVLKPGQQIRFGAYALQLLSVGSGDSHSLEQRNADAHSDRAREQPRFIYFEAALAAARDGKMLGVLRPQLRRYANRPDSIFSEVDTLFSWGNELYCSLLGIEENGNVTVQISVNPLVNWIWLGGTLFCLFPLLGLFSGRRRPEAEA
jgi:cytochrome c-type biogenesis protein CcmF